MFIVGHIVIPLVLVVEKLWAPALPIHFMLWTAVTLALTFALMPRRQGRDRRPAMGAPHARLRLCRPARTRE